MSTSLTTTQNDVLTIASHTDQMLKFGATMLKSGLLPNGIKTPEAAVAIMLKGRELGMPPMEAFSSIHIIQGKPTLSAQLMLALAERSGQLEDYKVEDNGKACTVTIKRKGRSAHTETFSMDDAKSMELTGRDQWKKQPTNMRKWRAMSAALRVTFADVLSGMYSPEEMGAEVDDEGEIVVVQDAVVEDVNGNGTDSPPGKPWIETAAGIKAHEFFDDMKELLSEDTYYRILEEHSVEHRTGLHDEEQGLAVCKEMGKMFHKAFGITYKQWMAAGKPADKDGAPLYGAADPSKPVGSKTDGQQSLDTAQMDLAEQVDAQP